MTNTGVIDGGNGGNAYTGQAKFQVSVVSGGAGGSGIALPRGTVTNSGTIRGGAGGSASVKGGATGGPGPGGAGLRFQRGGTLTNTGTIIGGAGAYAVSFGTGASRLIVDGAGGSFTGGVSANPAYANVVELASCADLALTASTAGTLTLAGAAYMGFNQFTIDSGGTLNVAASTAPTPGVTLTDSGTLNNAGTLLFPVMLGSGGYLKNNVSATISSASGIPVRGAGTLWTNGLISGATYAVQLAPGFANLVILGNKSATFSGIVSGGNPMGVGPSSTLEIVGAVQPNGLGSEFIDFAQVTIAGSPTLTGANSVVAGVPVTNSSASALADNGVLTNAGAIYGAAGVQSATLSPNGRPALNRTSPGPTLQATEKTRITP